jgi:peroxiredoxin
VLLTGAKAPDFSVKDQSGKDVKLSGLAGKRVLLSFHPLAWTPVCSEQMKSLEKYAGLFEKNNCVAFGISVDSVPSKNSWAATLGIKITPLLADFWPHGAVAQKYEIFRSADGFSERANVLIDEMQTVIFARKYKIS